MKRPLFIVGFPRSGTTLIRSIITQHSKINLRNEPELIFALRNKGYSVPTWSSSQRTSLINYEKRDYADIILMDLIDLT